MNEKYYLTRTQIEMLLLFTKRNDKANRILRYIKEKQNITNRWMELLGSPKHD